MKCTATPIVWVFMLFVQVLPVLAQPGDLTRDQEFFTRQAGYYQDWLVSSGIGQYLRLREIEVKPQELAVYLEFVYHDFDSIKLSWELLQETFEENSPLTLEQQLFYRAVNLMNIRQGLINVQIYDTYDLSREPFFFVGIYHDGSGVKTQEDIGARSVTKNIQLSPPIDSDKELAMLSFREKYTREYVFEKILGLAKEKYTVSPCEGRFPEVELIENETILRFEVLDLCREVLTDETQPTLCATLQSLGYSCNWVKREMLIFTVTYREVESGVELSVDIDGRFGSGYYDSVGRAGYYPMDEDYKEYLERYALKFKTELLTLFR